MILPKATNLPATQQFKQTNQLPPLKAKKLQKNASSYIEKNSKSAMSIKENQLSIELKKPSCFLQNQDGTTMIVHMHDIKMLANHFSTMLIHTDFKLDAAIF